MANQEEVPSEVEDHEYDPMSDPEERRVLYAALDSFRQYRRAAHYNVTHLRRQAFYSLPASSVDLLSSRPFSLPQTFNAVDEAIESNAEIAEAILDVGLQSFGIDADDDSWKGVATPNDMDKARSTIRQFYRDWSAEGQHERNASYRPILKALAESFRSPPSRRHEHRILIPGAGLGRLVFEICSEGYTVEGNEISYHQLLASNFILNTCQKARQYTLYPWALSFSNHLKRENQLRSSLIPDIHPGIQLAGGSATVKSEVHYSERMSMTAGDFCDLYRRPSYTNVFDAIATCFFIDTAPNFIAYVETIRHCLRPGGLWINLGPLLWHFESAPTPAEREKERRGAEQSTRSAPFVREDNVERSRDATTRNAGIGEPGSFELSNEEVIALVETLGFRVLEEKQSPGGPTGYIQDPESMLQNFYRPSFWVAQKR